MHILSRLPVAKGADMKNVAFLALATALAASSCLSVPMPTLDAYDGPRRPESELSRVTFKGTGFIDIVLYSVDGVPRLVHDKDRIPGSYTNGMCGFDLLLLPGRHVFAYYDNRQTPFDARPINYRIMTFSTEAGKAYEWVKTGADFEPRLDGVAVPFTIEPMPVLAEPAESEPHATLVFRREGGATGPNVWLTMMDGRIRKAMHRCDPRWVFMNDVSVAGTFDPGEASLELRLVPGPHLMEYMTDRVVVAKRFMSSQVKRLSFTAEAGKTYLITVVPATDPGLDDSYAVLTLQ